MKLHCVPTIHEFDLSNYPISPPTRRDGPSRFLWFSFYSSPCSLFFCPVIHLSIKLPEGKEAYVEPVIENGGYRFTVKGGNPWDEEVAKNGTKLKVVLPAEGGPVNAEVVPVPFKDPKKKIPKQAVR